MADRTHDLAVENQRVEAALALAETERKTAQEALETVEEQSIQLLRMDHIKSRIFANISHEFRTPLTLILDPLDRAASGAFGPIPDHASDAFERASENAHRLLALINQLLDLAKLESGNMDLQAQEHDLIPFLRRSVELFASEATRRGIDLRFVAEVPRLRAWVDAQKLETVIQNLLTNALKATGEGGKTILSVRVAAPEGASDDGAAAGSAAEITVRDTGEGIDEAERPFIFDRFYQAETGRLKGGTGIGLSLAREIVDLHHGTIDVESVSGFGSTFTLRLPLGHAHLAAHEVGHGAPQASARPPEPAPPRPERPAEPPGDARRPLVLVVEDNPEIRQLVVDHLRPLYRVVEAEDGAAALRLARTHRPVLVVSDVLMPGMDGLALCRRIKHDDELCDTPVILLTARASSADRLEALRTGADDFLTKPFSAEELLTRAANLIQSRSAMRDRYSDRLVFPTTGQAIASADAAVLERIVGAVDAHLDEETFTVGQLAAEVGMSESSLKRRVRALVGTTPVEFVRTRRLERAAALLLGQAGTVGEVAAQVGFGSPSYFARCFRDRYGVLPSAYMSPDHDHVPKP